jgi:hypothetical protein
MMPVVSGKTCLVQRPRVTQSGTVAQISKCTSHSLSSLSHSLTELHRRMGNMTKAHAVYVEGTKKPLDYPDYLYEAWLAFERQNGTLADLEYAIMQVKRLRRNAETRRKKVSLLFSRREGGSDAFGNSWRHRLRLRLPSLRLQSLQRHSLQLRCRNRRRRGRRGSEVPELSRLPPRSPSSTSSQRSPRGKSTSCDIEG